MLTTWILVAWVGTSSNFMILHEAFSHKGCIEEKNTWQLVLKREIQLDCVENLKEGRSNYQRRPGSHGLVKK